MNNRNIKSYILDKQNILIGELIGKLLKTLIKEVGILSLKESNLLKKNIENRIIDVAVTYSLALTYDEFNVSSYDECLLSIEINNQKGYFIPEKNRILYKKYFNDYMNKYLEESNHLFLVDISKEPERWRMIESGVISQIKLQYNTFMEEGIEREQPIELCELLFKKNLNGILFRVISNSIVGLLCYENGEEDKEKCEKITLGYSLYNYNYELEEYSKNIIYKRAHEFLKNYMSKKKLDKQEAMASMLETVTLAKKEINYIFDHYSEKSTENEYKEIYDEYKIFLEHSRERIINSSKFSQFFKYLKKAKMDQIMEYKEKNIYPFIYDLLVMSFSLNMKMIAYRKERSSIKALLEMQDKSKSEYVRKNSSRNYLDLDFIELMKILPDRFDNMTCVVIKHYSEVLNTNYESVAIIFKQLISDKTRGNLRNKYSLENDLINKNISLKPKYLRSLSLEIV